MTLDEPAVCLRIERLNHRLYRTHEPRVDPRRHLRERAAIGLQPQNQRGKNALRPRGARFVSSGDHDVAVADTETIPASAVEVMVAVLVYALRSGATHDGSIR